MRDAKPLPGVVLYQFSGSLFFANCHLLQEDLLQALQTPVARKLLFQRIQVLHIGHAPFGAA